MAGSWWWPEVGGGRKLVVVAGSCLWWLSWWFGDCFDFWVSICLALVRLCGVIERVRLIEVLSCVTSFCKWFNHICSWTRPFYTVLVHVLFLSVVYNPQMIMSSILLYLLVIGVWRYKARPRYPPHMDIKLSYGDRLTSDELDEEFDSFSSSKNGDALKMRYDRLRSVGSMIQICGDYGWVVCVEASFAA